MLFNWIDFPTIGDDRGSLIALEAEHIVPFNIKRIYYIFDTKANVSRGFHSHRKLQQLMVCVSGHCSIVLDDGEERGEHVLTSPAKGLLVKEMIWREMKDFSDNCILLVLASEHYDESDYIRNYEDFCLEVTNG